MPQGIIQHYLYVLPDGGPISVYDMDHAHTLAGTIPVPPQVTFVRGMGADPAGHALYIAYGSGHLYAFSASGCGQTICSPLWSATIGTMSNAIVSSSAVANGVVFVGSSDGTLYAFDANGCGAATCSHCGAIQ